MGIVVRCVLIAPLARDWNQGGPVPDPQVRARVHEVPGGNLWKALGTDSVETDGGDAVLEHLVCRER